MLAQRVVTAIALLVLLLPALFASVDWPLAVLTMAAIGTGGWEWSRLNGLSGPASLASGFALAAACAVALLAGGVANAPAALWWTATLIWVVGGAMALRQGVSGWPRWAGAARVGVGLTVLWLAWLALASAKVIGVNFIMSVFCAVWMADIAAFAGGKALGRRKLAPTISPGKSWEGALTGMIGVVCLSFAWAWIDARPAVDSPSLFAHVRNLLGAPGLLITAVALSAMSVVGDLVESLVKRSAGAKDSSGLLPGHGGVLDRIDALLPVFPLALALRSL